MSQAWLSALKEFNKGKAKWTIPKKGTKDYLLVKKTMAQHGSGAKKSKLPKNEFDSVSLEDSFDYPVKPVKIIYAESDNKKTLPKKTKKRKNKSVATLSR